MAKGEDLKEQILDGLCEIAFPHKNALPGDLFGAKPLDIRERQLQLKALEILAKTQGMFKETGETDTPAARPLTDFYGDS